MDFSIWFFVKFGNQVAKSYKFDINSVGIVK